VFFQRRGKKMYKLINYAEASSGIKEFIADTVEDLDTIRDCEMGSICLVLSNKTMYIKNGNGEWIAWT
jgi:hypothetical protein